MTQRNVRIEPDPIDTDPDRYTVHIGTALNVLTLRSSFQGRPDAKVIFNVCGPFPAEWMGEIAEALLELRSLADQTQHRKTAKGTKHGKESSAGPAGSAARRGRR